MSSTHTLPVNIFNLDGGETMLARDKGNFHALGKNRTRDPSVEWLERPINMWYSGGREFNARPRYENFRSPDFSSFQVENVHWKCMCDAH